MHYKHLFILTFIISLITGNCVYGQNNNSYNSEFGFTSDNDAYLAMGQDQYYTNGLFVNYRKVMPEHTIHNTRVAKKIWEIKIGQQIYNAKSGYVPGRQFIDRPFAGYLFGSFSRHWLFKNENGLKAELQIGTIGDRSFSKEGQELYHEALGFYEINGWQYQIQDGLGINARVSYLYKITQNQKNNIDLSLPASALLGNSFSGLRAGLLFRTGKINPLNNSMATNSNLAHTGRYEGEFYFFLKPELNWIAYDATISGSMLRKKSENEVTFDSKPFVFSQELGLAYAKSRWNLGFSLIFKTKEIESSAKAHQYGSIKMGYKFGKRYINNK